MTSTPGPAITCSACGYTWTIRSMRPGDNLLFAYDVEEACPRCGAVDRSIRTGDTFSAQDDGSVRRLALALRPPDVTRADYEQLVDVLHSSLSGGASAEQAAEAVAEQSRFAALAQWIRTYQGDLALLLQLVSVILATVNMMKSAPAEAPPAEQSNITVHELNVYDDLSEETVRRLVDEELQRREQQRGGLPEER